ncbi:hypothetical protein LR004_01315 [Candidatus Gracilibacteria bacterium]|nr:hypothetical protein [Candidatus Gracilibacteria bacterium]
MYLVSFLILLIIISNYSGFNSSQHSVSASDDLFIRSTTGSRFLFPYFNSPTFVLNRIIWIPFITSIDWLNYFSTIDGYFHGATIPGIYKLLGHDARVLVENEVFIASYLSGEGSLGTANTHFSLDAFVNFGYAGVVAYSFLAGAIISTIFKVAHKPANFISYNYVYALSFSSLHANILGGGIWLVLASLLFIYLIPKKGF